LALRRVTFQYTEEVDPKGTAQFGLVAEEVDQVSPDLVIRDASNRAFTVRYEAVNAMLLNEIQKNMILFWSSRMRFSHLPLG